MQTWSTVWRGLGDERALTVGRLWDGNVVHEPDTEFSAIVATDAMLDSVEDSPEYQWLSEACAVIIDEGHRAGDSERYTRLLTMAWRCRSRLGAAVGRTLGYAVPGHFRGRHTPPRGPFREPENSGLRDKPIPRTCRPRFLGQGPT